MRLPWWVTLAVLGGLCLLSVAGFFWQLGVLSANFLFYILAWVFQR